MHEGLRLLPANARKDAEAWVARLESEERARVDTRRKELANDPRAEELEHLLGNTDGAGDAPDEQ
ncbi:hypothetical protein ACLESD_27530 [Pyxidicoccus sp. 3LFB2]